MDSLAVLNYHTDVTYMTMGANGDKLFVSINCAEYPLSHIPIEYLNQLQNVYFDLVGSELEIKM
jgi:hypothetical protein